MTTQQRQQQMTTVETLYKLLDKFEQAVRDEETLGSKPPEDHAAIRFSYNISKLVLRTAISNYVQDSEMVCEVLTKLQEMEKEL